MWIKIGTNCQQKFWFSLPVCWQKTETFVTMEAKEAAKMKNYSYIVYHLSLHKTTFIFL